jgi:hypothetical protein
LNVLGAAPKNIQYSIINTQYSSVISILSKKQLPPLGGNCGGVSRDGLIV